jgi:transglutaminase-like putative cysteine protease
VLRHIRSDGYSYTLSPGEYGRDSVDEFWLDRKEGFCEHFAASFVVVMRALGVPARIVTGYQGATRCRRTATRSCGRARRTPGPSTGSRQRLDPRRPDRAVAPRPHRPQHRLAPALGWLPAPSTP